jgi:hypothetical protein
MLIIFYILFKYINHMDEKFWTEDPTVLFNNYYIILPGNKMNRVEQLNTVSRFIIYFIILCIIFNAGTNIIIYLLVGLILIIIFFYIYKSDPIGIKNDLLQETLKLSEKFTTENDSCSNCRENFEINKPAITLYDNVKNKIFKGDSIPNVNFASESGYIDSDGNYKIGPDYTDINYKEYTDINKTNKQKKISWEKNNDYVKETCRKPTVSNPFTNIVFSDYLDSGNLAEPCNIDDDDVQNQMQNLYNSSIYRNLEDVWERENSQRMFYTVPIQTVPNSQTDFANWLYKTGPSCKENTQYCTYYQAPNMISSRY